MDEVGLGIIGLGNVGSGTLAMLAENAESIALKLGFRLKVMAVCSRTAPTKQLPAAFKDVFRTTDWREVVAHPGRADRGRTGGRHQRGRARSSMPPSQHRKSVVTANKELMAACGPEIWDRAIRAGINLAMEASVCGGIPIHAVLREGISGDRVHGPLRHPQRHLQLHPHRDGEAQRAARHRARRSAAPGICRGRPERRYRWLRRALQAGAAGGAGVRREDHALGHLHGRHPPHLAAGFPVRHAVEAHHPPGLRRAQDSRRPDPLRAAGADSVLAPSWPACRAPTTPSG